MSGRLSRNLKRLESEAIEVMREVVAEFRKIVHVNREGVVRGVDPIRSDAAQYILAEELPVVPLYFAAPRPVVRRAGALIMVDDDRLPLEPGERPELLRVRFRTLGCYPLSGAIESDAQSGPRRIRSARRGWSISITAHRWNARIAKATSDG